MPSSIKLVESPRDAWQAMPKPIPTPDKVRYLRALIETGFRHLDAISFVSDRAVPQMADSELVLDYLDPPDDIEIIGLVATAEGAERAVKTRAVSTLAFPYSISPGFLDRNQRQTPEDALEQLEQIGEIAYKAGLDIVALVPMAFGNPFNDPWDIDEVISAVDLLVDAGVSQVSLSDSLGTATPRLLADVLTCTLGVHDSVEIGVRLRVAEGNAEEKIAAAYEAGCRRFDSTIAGYSTYPFPQQDVAANVPTELLVKTLRSLGARIPPLRPLDGLVQAARHLDKRFGTPLQ